MHIVTLSTRDRTDPNDEDSRCTVALRTPLIELTRFRVRSLSAPLSAHTFNSRNNTLSWTTLTPCSFTNQALTAIVSQNSTFGSDGFGGTRGSLILRSTTAGAQVFTPNATEIYTAATLQTALQNAWQAINVAVGLTPLGGGAYSIDIGVPSVGDPQTWQLEYVAVGRYRDCSISHITSFDVPAQTALTHRVGIWDSQKLVHYSESSYTTILPIEVFTLSTFVQKLNAFAATWAEQPASGGNLFLESGTAVAIRQTRLGVEFASYGANAELGPAKLTEFTPSATPTAATFPISGELQFSSTLVPDQEGFMDFSTTTDYSMSEIVTKLNTQAYVLFTTSDTHSDRLSYVAAAAGHGIRFYAKGAGAKVGFPVNTDILPSETGVAETVSLDGGNIRMYLALPSLYNQGRTSSADNDTSSIVCDLCNDVPDLNGRYLHTERDNMWLPLSYHDSVKTIDIRLLNNRFNQYDTVGLPLYLTLEFE